MKNFIKYFAASLLLITLSTAKAAEVQFGLAFIGGQTNVSGTETEGTAADTSNRSEEISEVFVGADIFAEYILDSGLAFGVSYVPLDIELGDGARTDGSGGADIASEADTGTRSASANAEDLVTLYANYPLGDGGMYGLLGAHFVTITTEETLPNSSYGNEDIMGAMIGIGHRSGNLKYEIAYSDFEDISLTASGGNTSSVSADADAVTLRISYGF